MPIIKSASELLGRDEPIRGSHWEFDITDSPIGPMPKDLEVVIRSIPELSATLAAPVASCINSEVAFPGGRESVRGSVGIHMYTTPVMLKWWWKWWSSVYNKGRVALFGDIVGQGVVRFLGADLSVVHTFELMDVWPSAISIKPQDQDDEGSPVSYEVSLQIAEINLL